MDNTMGMPESLVNDQEGFKNVWSTAPRSLTSGFIKIILKHIMTQQPRGHKTQPYHFVCYSSRCSSFLGQVCLFHWSDSSDFFTDSFNHRYITAFCSHPPFPFFSFFLFCLSTLSIFQIRPPALCSLTTSMDPHLSVYICSVILSLVIKPAFTGHLRKYLWFGKKRITWGRHKCSDRQKWATLMGWMAI